MVNNKVHWIYFKQIAMCVGAPKSQKQPITLNSGSPQASITLLNKNNFIYFSGFYQVPIHQFRYFLMQVQSGMTICHD